MNTTAELKIQILLAERSRLSEKADKLLDQIKAIDEKIGRIKEFENSRISRSSTSSRDQISSESPTLQASNIFGN